MPRRFPLACGLLLAPLPDGPVPVELSGFKVE
jgi:hypothetical protein